MKRLLMAGAAFAVALSMTMSAGAQDKKTLVFVANGASDFWKAAETGVKKAQSELPEYNMEFKYPSQSAAAIQQRLLDDLVAAGVTGIMVSAVDPKTETEALSNVGAQSSGFTRKVERRKAVAGWLAALHCVGRPCRPTPLRCSPRGRVAELASLTSFAALKQPRRVR